MKVFACSIWMPLSEMSLTSNLVSGMRYYSGLMSPTGHARIRLSAKEGKETASTTRNVGHCLRLLVSCRGVGRNHPTPLRKSRAITKSKFVLSV